MKKEEVLKSLAYEKASGLHTFSMCECGRMGCRGSKCVLCLKESLGDKDEYI